MSDKNEIINTSDCDDDKGVFLSFNKTALKKIAGECLHKQCTSITMINYQGNYKVYLLGMDDGSECIARLAYPDFHQKVKNEVTTMQYLMENTSIFVPKIYAWDSDPGNVVGVEYILIEKTPGLLLKDVWDDMLIEQKEKVLRQIAEIMFNLFSLTFSKIGGLDRTADGDYIVGPVVNFSFLFGGREDLDIDRGPWATSHDYFFAAAQRELALPELKFPTMSWFREMRDTYERLVRVVPAFNQKDPDLERCAFRHDNICPENIIVDGTRITSVIAWDCLGAYPAWSCAMYPFWFDIKDRAQLRDAFRNEVAERDPLFLKALDEGERYRDFEAVVNVTWEGYKAVARWIEALRDEWNEDEPFPLAIEDKPPLVWDSEESEESELSEESEWSENSVSDEWESDESELSEESDVSEE